MSTCPTEDTLRLLDTELLGEGTYGDIERHVEGCAGCQAALERLARRPSDASARRPEPKAFPRVPGFEIQAELGRGGMASVYLANKSGQVRPVALKVLSHAPGQDDGTAQRRRWLREVRAVVKVRHPNVVPLYDYGEAAGRFFLVL